MGHTLNLGWKSSVSRELEDNHFANSFRVPVIVPTYEHTLVKSKDRNLETNVEYALPLAAGGKLEAGYTVTLDRLEADFLGESLDLNTATWNREPAKSNRFNHDRTIHALYVTYARTWDKFGLMAGVRPEWVDLTSTLVDTGTTIPSDYSRVYPNLHLTYQPTDRHELQLNYSHRVHRPDSDDLNPFPDYDNPFAVQAGNLHLRPEDIHSVEAGYSYRKDDLNLTSTVYYRHLYHGFTTVTRDIGNSMLLTTRENLADNRFTGLELTATAELGGRVTLNFSSNTFFNTLDASNLGFSSQKTDVSWTAKLGATIRASKVTLVQFNANYVSSRLTPQGSLRSSWFTNIGLRHELKSRKAAIVLTVSDPFNSMREGTIRDTPLLREDIVRRRSTRIIYLGLVYNFGKAPSQPKEDALKFDNSI